MTAGQKEAPTATAAGANSPYPAIISDDGSDRRLFAWLKARAAKKHHTLIKVVDGFVIAKGAYSKHCKDLGTVDVLLARMGG